MAQNPRPPLDSSPPLIEGFTNSLQPFNENRESKFMHKFRENPLVPIGCLITTGVLTYGIICFKRGNTKQSQKMMRARVLAQGFTIASLLGGMVVSSYMKSPK